MTFDEIFEFIKETINESCGIEKEKILKESTLFDELAISSIDIIDIIYTIELEYDISIQISEFETATKKALGDKPYSIDGVLTEEALVLLREMLSDVPEEKLQFGIVEQDVIKLITVGLFTNMVFFMVQKANEENKNNND